MGLLAQIILEQPEFILEFNEAPSYVPVEDNGTDIWRWLGANAVWMPPVALVLWFALWPVRRYIRQLRRREPWSAERGLWAQAGFHPTGRILRKYHRYGKGTVGWR